jgi:hypothetical protein
VIHHPLSCVTPVPHSIQASQIGLVHGGTYSLSIFNAERHTSGSHFTARTSLTTLTSAVTHGVGGETQCPCATGQAPNGQHGAGCLFVCLPARPPARPSVHTSVGGSVCLSVGGYVGLSVCRPVCQSACLPACLPSCPPACLPAFLSLTRRLAVPL